MNTQHTLGVQLPLEELELKTIEGQVKHSFLDCLEDAPIPTQEDQVTTVQHHLPFQSQMKTHSEPASSQRWTFLSGTSEMRRPQEWTSGKPEVA